MKTRTILSTLVAAFLVASLAAPALAGTQARKQVKKAGASTSGQKTMTQDRMRDGSCQR
jgi:hypothetical protein